MITGHGWGHGMGMSQWGAYGYALHGWSYSRILEHYYQGTTIGTVPSPVVRVLLLDRQHRVALTSVAPWNVVDANGTRVTLPVGRLVLRPSLEIDGHALVSPLTFDSRTAPLEVGRLPYHGKIVVVSNGQRLQVVNAVSMEDYVAGVVGGEEPDYWPLAALEAQAIAARSYALAQLETVVTASTFDVYSDSRSQVYGGIAAETPSIESAVTATAHLAVLYQGHVATTYFSSSSGGRTVSAAEAIGTAIPYLVSVADPYDTLSPNHDWGPVLVGAGEAAKDLGLQGGLVDLATSPGPSGHIEAVTAVGPYSQMSLTGAQVESDFGLRSAWFSFGWLTLTPVPTAVAPGAQVTLVGTARNMPGVTLEGRTPGAAWGTVAQVTPDSEGAFAVPVSPAATTQYRLASGAVRGALIKVKVASS